MAAPAVGYPAAAAMGFGPIFTLALKQALFASILAQGPVLIGKIASGFGWLGTGIGGWAGFRVGKYEGRRLLRNLGGNARNLGRAAGAEFEAGARRAAGNTRNFLYSSGTVARNAGFRLGANFRTMFRAAGGDARELYKIAGRDIHGATLSFIELLSYGASKPIEYIISKMPNFSGEEKIAVSKFISSVYSNSGNSFYVFIVLITVALANMVSRGEFGVKSNASFFKLVEMVLDAAHNVGQKGSAGVYKLVQVFAQLVGFVWENGGRPALTHALRYASGYYKLLDKPTHIKDTQPILKALQKAENKATAVLQNKSNKVAAKTNSPQIKANSLAELEIKAKMAGATAKHKKQIEALKAKTPGNNNAQAALKFHKLKNKKEQAYKALMEECKKKLEALKTPRVKLPSPPTPQQVAKINNSIRAVAKNSPNSNNNNSPNSNNNNSPTPSQKKTPLPLSASHVYSAVAGHKKAQKKKLHWWNSA